MKQPPDRRTIRCDSFVEQDRHAVRLPRLATARCAASCRPIGRKRSLTLVAIVSALAAAITSGQAAAAGPPKSTDPLVDRGRYVVTIGGCNDCHTPGYGLQGGKVDEKQWLVGDTLGWRGPWGTTYPVNLRQYMQTMSEKEWVAKAKTLETRPPMPWFALHAMTENDLRAIYRFIRALGPAGEPAPAYVPPTQEPKPPYVVFPAPPK